VINLQKLIEETEKDPEPGPDIAICQECDWRGSLSECGTEQDGDWETGYYLIHTCPKCDDCGMIEYDMSEKRALEWNAWKERRKGDKK